MKKISAIIFFAGFFAAVTWILTGSNDNASHDRPTSVNPASAKNRESDRTISKDSQTRQLPSKSATSQGGELAGISYATKSGNFTPSNRTEQDGDGSSIVSSLNSDNLSYASSHESPEQSAALDLNNSRRGFAVAGTINPQMSSILSSVSPPLLVPPGARLPALFLDERSLPMPQRRVLDRMANEFIDTVASDPSGQNRALWENARKTADTQYIKLYGHAAYNALHMQAAKEAVLEQRALSSQAQP